MTYAMNSLPRNLMEGSPSAPTLSIVVPMRNEAPNLQRLFDRLLPALAATELSHEVVCVDDGSTDDTFERLRQFSAELGVVRAISLSRNFGKEIAVIAGLSRTRGRAVIVMDADLQHPPEAIPALVEAWRRGFPIVYGQRLGLQQDAAHARRFASKAFYRIFNALSEIRLDPESGDFALLDRKVVNTILALPERHRFNRGLIAWAGFRHTTVPVAIEARHAGTSQWGFTKLLRHAVHAVTSFGNFPLRMWSYIGLVVSACALLYGMFVIIDTLLFGADVPGYPSLLVAILFSSGIQLIGLGFIGEYLGKVYSEVKRRPLFVIGDEAGFEASPVTAPGGATLAQSHAGLAS
jgi:glycosyltransferase involved in cell wall biosynthesis